MKVIDVLRKKGEEIVTTTADCTISDALKLLYDHRISALLVMETDNLVGLINDDDIRDYKQGMYDPSETKVSEVMNPNIIVALQDDDVNYVMGVMTNNKINHLPIMGKNGIIGIITLSDLRNSIF